MCVAGKSRRRDDRRRRRAPPHLRVEDRLTSTVERAANLQREVLTLPSALHGRSGEIGWRGAVQRLCRKSSHPMCVELSD